MGVLTHPAWGAIWVFSIAIITLAYLWERAPFKQRDEARAALRSDHPGFISMDLAGRLYRDLMVEFGMSEAVKMLDRETASEFGGKGSVASAFRWTLVHAINEGRISVTGVPANGSKRETIGEVDDTADAWAAFEAGDAEMLCANDVFYRDILVKEADVVAYAKYVRDHDAELERRKKERQSRRLHKGT